MDAEQLKQVHRAVDAELGIPAQSQKVDIEAEEAAKSQLLRQFAGKMVAEMPVPHA